MEGKIGNEYSDIFHINTLLITITYQLITCLFRRETDPEPWVRLFQRRLLPPPETGHTDTFISIGSFESAVQAQNCLKYIKSKFARTMLGILKITQHNPASTWKYVPLQDFTPNSDIDWSQSVADIDRQLYAKYGLNDEEIAFIESHVKEMD